MQMFNVQKLICFYFAFSYIILFTPVCFLPALLNFYFAFIYSLLCFNLNWNVFLTNIRHVFLGARRDHLSEMVLLSAHKHMFFSPILSMC